MKQITHSPCRGFKPGRAEWCVDGQEFTEADEPQVEFFAEQR